MAPGNTTTRRPTGTSIVHAAMPVPAPHAGVTDVIRRSARLGLGALGLAGRAAGTMFARVPDPGGSTDAEPGVASLVPGALLGLTIEAERRAASVVDAVGAFGRRRPAPRRSRPSCSARCDRSRTRSGGGTRWLGASKAEPGAGLGAHSGHRPAGHRERHRPARLRAHRRADPHRRDRRFHRRRGDRAAHRSRRRDPRVDREPHHRGRRCRSGAGYGSRRCARAAGGSRPLPGGQKPTWNVGQGTWTAKRFARSVSPRGAGQARRICLASRGHGARSF